MARPHLLGVAVATALGTAVPVFSQSKGTFMPVDNIFVMDTVSIPTKGDWIVKTDRMDTEDNSVWFGKGYIEWTGPDLFGTPGKGARPKHHRRRV